MLALFRCSAQENNSIPEIVDQELPVVAFIEIQSELGGVNGSGFIVDNVRGHVMTNWHVVKGIESGWVKVKYAEWMPITGILAKDENRDLALIAVDVKDNALKSARLGSIQKVQQGQTVIAIGNPLGEEYTVTDGIVSAIRERDGYKYIQTSAPISPGNSGGPLFNEQGEVIGITTFSIRDTEGLAQNLNFAVAIDEAKPLMGTNSLLKEVATGTKPEKETTSMASLGSLAWIHLLVLFGTCVFIYVVSTFYLFGRLIRDPTRHPAHAFGISSALTFGGIIFAITFFGSGAFEYMLNMRNSFSHNILLIGILFSCVLATILFLVGRSQQRRH